jgi:hypothetical protein
VRRGMITPGAIAAALWARSTVGNFSRVVESENSMLPPRKAQSVYAGRPVLRLRVLDVMRSNRCGWPWTRTQSHPNWMCARTIPAARCLSCATSGWLSGIDRGRYILTYEGTKT